MCVKFCTTYQSQCLPFQQYKIQTKVGEKELVWGDKSTKKFNQKIGEINNDEFEKGILQINGFYVFKKEKAIAPIGFGDHKESLKLTEYIVAFPEYQTVNLSVIIVDDKFYLLVDDASSIIKEFQPNEPLITFNIFWNDLSDLQKVSSLQLQIKPKV